jgi:hypothetical protein
MRHVAWGAVLLFTAVGAVFYTKVFLLLPLLCLLFEGNACIEISQRRLAFGTSYFGLLLVEEELPLRAIRDIRVQEHRFRQWGIYRGLEDDANAGARGQNLVQAYLVLDEGVAEVKLPMGLSVEEHEWLADYLQSFSRTLRPSPASAA